MRTKTKKSLSGLFAVLIPAVLAGTFADCLAEKSKAGKKAPVNSLCYVCHYDLQTEKIATVHLKHDVACDNCHGASTNHMHDEMLMTKPDVLIGRTEVEDLCRNCHKSHKKPEVVKAFRKKWLGRRRPNGRVINEESICTDCHGAHNIVKREIGESDKGQDSEWISAFNGQNLKGWQASGGASWTVKRGRLVAALGSKGKGGDLLTEKVYEDYLLSVTFQANWSVKAGIWLRAGESGNGPRVEIFESGKPAAFTGSVRVSGDILALVNLREDLVDKQGWNTIAVEVRDNKVSVWLNGEEVGAVKIAGPKRGRIGLHVEKPHGSKAGELSVREVQIKPLGGDEKQVSAL